jgi:hypothetical protein
MEVDPAPSTRVPELPTTDVASANSGGQIPQSEMEVDQPAQQQSEVVTETVIEQTVETETTTITTVSHVAPSDVFGAPPRAASPLATESSVGSPLLGLRAANGQTSASTNHNTQAESAPGPSFVDPITTFAPAAYTTNSAPRATSPDHDHDHDPMASLIQQTQPTQITTVPRMYRTGYVYDPLMMLHCAEGYTPTADDREDSGGGHPEEPMRIKRIFARLAEHGLIRRMKKLVFDEITEEQSMLVHTQDHWDKVQGTERECDGRDRS